MPKFYHVRTCATGERPSVLRCENVENAALFVAKLDRQLLLCDRCELCGTKLCGSRVSQLTVSGLIGELSGFDSPGAGLVDLNVGRTFQDGLVQPPRALDPVRPHEERLF